MNYVGVYDAKLIITKKAAKMALVPFDRQHHAKPAVLLCSDFNKFKTIVFVWRSIRGSINSICFRGGI